jgi:hypothetical protein
MEQQTFVLILMIQERLGLYSYSGHDGFLEGRRGDSNSARGWQKAGSRGKEMPLTRPMMYPFLYRHLNQTPHRRLDRYTHCDVVLVPFTACQAGTAHPGVCRGFSRSQNGLGTRPKTIENKMVDLFISQTRLIPLTLTGLFRLLTPAQPAARRDYMQGSGL